MLPSSTIYPTHLSSCCLTHLSLANQETVLLISRYLFHTRENLLFTSLGVSLQEGMIKGKNIFQIWNLEQSDLVQACARAFGEKLIIDEYMRVIGEYSEDSELSSLLKVLLDCYAWFVVEKVCTRERGNLLPVRI